MDEERGSQVDDEQGVKLSTGSYLIAKRGDQDRLFCFRAAHDTLMYGKGSQQSEIDLSGIEGQPEFSSFRMTKIIDDQKVDPKSDENKKEKDGPNQKGKFNKNHKNCKVKWTKYTLELVQDLNEVSFDVKEISGSGKDNRDIIDVTSGNQLISPLQIAHLKDSGVKSEKIIESLIINSKNFANKTEYSQEKYVKKKEAVYADVITFYRPTLAQLAEYYYKKDSSKILYIRGDTLSQLLTFGNVHSGGHYLVYETGTCGLLIAAILKRMGGQGLLLHAHAGNSPQRQIVSSMNFTRDQLKPLKSLDIFYIIRSKLTQKSTEEQEGEIDGDGEPAAKKMKKEDKISQEDETPMAKNISCSENISSTQLLQETKFDSLLIASKEHPLSILQHFSPKLKPSSNIVIYCHCVEPLVECYNWLKDCKLAVNLHLVENWFRAIQVDTNRTHPEINMNGNGGFILHGTYVIS